MYWKCCVIPWTCLLTIGNCGVINWQLAFSSIYSLFFITPDLIRQLLFSLLINIYRLKFKSGHQAYMFLVNCRAVSMFSCWAWHAPSYLCFKEVFLLLKDSWTEGSGLAKDEVRSMDGAASWEFGKEENHRTVFWGAWFPLQRFQV